MGLRFRWWSVAAGRAVPRPTREPSPMGRGASTPNGGKVVHPRGSPLLPRSWATSGNRLRSMRRRSQRASTVHRDRGASHVPSHLPPGCRHVTAIAVARLSMLLLYADQSTNAWRICSQHVQNSRHYPWKSTRRIFPTQDAGAQGWQ